MSGGVGARRVARRQTALTVALLVVAVALVPDAGTAAAGEYRVADDGFDYPVASGDCEHFRGRTYVIDAYRVERGADFDDPGYAAHFGRKHNGEDWNRGGSSDDLGDPLCAIGDGVVVEAADRGNGAAHIMGKVVTIRHALNDGTFAWSRYAHLDEILVEPGPVSRGDVVGTIGNANGFYGRFSHLHFEIWTGPTSDLTMASSVDASDVATDSHPSVGFIEANRATGDARGPAVSAPAPDPGPWAMISRAMLASPMLRHLWLVVSRLTGWRL